MKAKLAGPKNEQETVTRLLDAAERLFGELGYDGVGMRMLAAAADVNLGAATYHFGSKKNLYVETFLRRFRPTEAERLRMLREAEDQAGGNPLPVAKIVECLIRPPFDSTRKHRHFQKLLARDIMMPPAFMRAAIHKELAPGMQVFAAALRRALPDLPEDLIRLRTMFAMGGMFMFSLRANDLPEMQNPAAHEAVLREMVGYATAGLESRPVVPAGERPPLPMPPKLKR